MKFTMNGALTIGTLDGANVEIREAVGEENFFLFGKTIDQVDEIQATGYQPLEIYQKNEGLRDVIDLINSGVFSHGDRDMFRHLTDNLLYSDPFLVFADFQGYLDCQARVDGCYRDQDQWMRMSILNVARSGRFSSDRSIREYSDHIWDAPPLPVKL
jgi:starch phosphorylase